MVSTLRDVTVRKIKLTLWQESLANAKVYGRHNSLNHPPLAFFTVNNKQLVTQKCEVAPNSDKNLNLQLFKVIQGHRPWCQSKAHMQLPISHSSLVRNCVFNLSKLCLCGLFFRTLCRIIGVHFAADSIVYLRSNFCWWARVTFLFLQEWRFGRSRSSKPRSLILLPIESAYATPISPS